MSDRRPTNFGEFLSARRRPTKLVLATCHGMLGATTASPRSAREDALVDALAERGDLTLQQAADRLAQGGERYRTFLDVGQATIARALNTPAASFLGAPSAPRSGTPWTTSPTGTCRLPTPSASSAPGWIGPATGSSAPDQRASPGTGRPRKIRQISHACSRPAPARTTVSSTGFSI